MNKEKQMNLALLNKNKLDHHDLINQRVKLKLSDIIGRKPLRCADDLILFLGSNTYQPKVSNLESDWIARVCAPAFTRFFETFDQKVKNFCTIGTGSGLDAIVAIEVFNPNSVTMTDIHRSVAELAARNVLSNTKIVNSPLVRSLVGSGTEPLRSLGLKFDLIYENLPNIPNSNYHQVNQGINSSTFYNPRSGTLPGGIRKNLLELHYLFVSEAREFLTDKGAIVSSIGGRISIADILEVSEFSGLSGSILHYSWKIQSEPDDVIGGYALFERMGYGPFKFYPVEILDKTFAAQSTGDTANHAKEIELSLESHKIDARTALKRSRRGELIGHTVVALASGNDK